MVQCVQRRNLASLTLAQLRGRLYPGQRLTAISARSSMVHPDSRSGAQRQVNPPRFSANLIHEAEAEERPHGGEAVAPGDLLAFSIVAARIIDRHLVDAVALLQHLGGNLRFEIEAIALDLDALDDLRAKRLVAGLHVGEDVVVED